jgi:hypothetical protein
MMKAPNLDSDTIERLLSGRLEPDDAPPAYARVATLMRALDAPPTSGELAWEAQAVAAAVTIVAAARETAPTSPSKVRSSFFRAKVLSLVVTGTLLGTSGLAAAGVLPAPVQDAMHTILGKVGIEVPSSDDASNPSEPSTDDGTEQGSAGQSGPGASDEPHGKSDEPHGKSDEPHGKSDEPHGQSDDPHGNGNGQSDEPHGQSDQPHGQSNQPHGQSDDPPHGQSADPHGKSDAPHGDGNNHGNGHGTGNGGDPPGQSEDPPGNGNGGGNGTGNGGDPPGQSEDPPDSGTG